MRVDLTQAIERDDFDWTAETEYEPDSIMISGLSYVISEKMPVTVSVHHSEKGHVQIICRTGMTVSIPCDRCLKPVEHLFQIICEEECILPQHASEDSYVDGMFLDTDRMITHEILLQWPSKILCRPDCKGLCSVCGHDLNVSECGCNRVVPDPRMAAIQDLFQTFQQESEKS